MTRLMMLMAGMLDLNGLDFMGCVIVTRIPG
jgi:hypothetical protein